MIRYARVSLTVLLMGTAAPLHAVSLDEIDLSYKKSKTVEQLRKIESQVLESIGNSPSSDEWTWRMARIYFDLGKRSKGDVKEKFFARCLELTRKTLQLNQNSAYGYFFNGLCTGKWAEVQGIWDSLGNINPMITDMEAAIKIDPSVDHGGPHRFLGRLYYELPFILGGSLGKSADHLKKAVQYGPRYGENYLFLAETYYSRGEYKLAQEAILELLNVTRASQADIDTHQLRVRARDLLKEIETD
ncbi:MAG: TRAP transporter TatT component family protein [Nitrospinaceae bacterium]